MTGKQHIFADISTHALTWSATGCNVGVLHLPKISTHALTWSATILFNVVSPTNSDFNSRTHVECDQMPKIFENDVTDFNSRTHVECDLLRRYLCIWACYFNSRTHVECDCSFCIPHPDRRIFQLTHSRGVRHLLCD